ncbi:beta-1,3-glucanase family protein [Actinoallomurus soli]|uniref:beta-1,3-glucanase family protein n=1 Tax=Actinoallomurus soli TaxID=2952535 RepID=UPI0020929C09|nr:beta-1,3-glucanase family protein [Actinoallomurus soli]MCO5969655.1 beta-1,3-glucanase family protein [Actinoallomurus soli]
MIGRRSFLASTAALGALALGGGATGCAPSSRARSTAATAGGLPLTAVNRTGAHAAAPVYMYVLGVDPATGAQGRVTADGAFVPCAASDNGPDGFADYAIPFRDSGKATVVLPKMSGRVYFSIGDRLRLKVVTDGNGRPALQYPAGWVGTDPNYRILHDWIEFTYNDAGMFCNTTAVDMFSVPLAIRLAGTRTRTTGTLASGGRDRIFAAVAAHPDFARLVVGDRLRVIAPGHGIEAGLFPADYYDPYIDAVWSRYRGTPLTVRTDAGTYTGTVTGERLTFSGGARTPGSIARPSTRDVLFCGGALAAPNDGVTGPVAAILGAAFNRSTLLSDASQPVTDPARYYREAVTNHYAKAMHEAAAGGAAYGFAFDDVAGHASYIQDGAPTSVTVTLTPF